jgi:hypothetical protein
MAPGPTSLPITSSLVPHTAGGVTLPIAHLWVELAVARRGAARLFRKCLFDSGAPVSVIPQATQQAQPLDWQPLPGPWPAGLLAWQGVPCALGQVEVWVPLPALPYLRGPLTLIAKFPQAHPVHVPATMPILLGLNFLAAYQAATSFQCHLPPKAGTIVLP